MNDRFKFRIFNKAVKKFIYFDNSELCIDRENMGLLFRSEHLYMGNYEELQQCTGLKDKNGTLIYEGDILQCNQMPTKGLCEWFKDGFWVNYFVNGAKRELRNMHNWYEVIGNIYENKEILEELNA